MGGYTIDKDEMTRAQLFYEIALNQSSNIDYDNFDEVVDVVNGYFAKEKIEKRNKKINDLLSESDKNK